jgi:hypothetical protein
MNTEQLMVGNRDNVLLSLRSGHTGRGCLHIYRSAKPASMIL